MKERKTLISVIILAALTISQRSRKKVTEREREEKKPDEIVAGVAAVSGGAAVERGDFEIPFQNHKVVFSFLTI